MRVGHRRLCRQAAGLPAAACEDADTRSPAGKLASEDLTLLCCACQGPRCSIRSRKLYSDAIPDYGKMTLLNLPAAVLVRAPPERQSRVAHCHCAACKGCLRHAWVCQLK
jgi:hypothetical protein